MKNLRAQSLTEYVIVLGLVVVALTTMQVYMRRGIQAVVKVSADELGFQQNSEDVLDPAKQGFLRSFHSQVNSQSQRRMVGVPGVLNKDIDESSTFSLNGIYFLGNEEKSL
ncbi:MAG: hypothetical protein Q8O13_11215 [Candidatus Omnitrophota bacterium]|nr:hypothetical protein [Candidatus Omnitrophota bacterium]